MGSGLSAGKILAGVRPNGLNDEPQYQLEIDDEAARALGLGDAKIIRRHILPNAMTATLSYLPFILTGAISTLSALDFLGFGMPAGSASLGELIAQGKQNLQAPWLGLTAFFTLALILSLLVFIGEALRDAFDPRS